MPGSIPAGAHGRQKALTLVEVAVAAAVFGLLMAALHGLYVGASTSTVRSVEYGDALRSVVIAMEYLRRDLEQMLYQCPTRDLAVFDDGRGLSVRVPNPASLGDPWKARHDPVTYTLKPVAGYPGIKRLVRKDGRTGEEKVIQSCLLRDLKIEMVPFRTNSPLGLSELQAYLEITMIGAGSERGTASYTASLLHPLVLMAPTGLYSAKL